MKTKSRKTKTKASKMKPRKLQTKKHFSLWRAIVCGVMVGIVGTYFVWQGSAAVTFTQVGTHPQAINQPTSSGRTLQDLFAFNGKIYSGYGNYTDNDGPIAITPYTHSSGTFSQLFTQQTEAILNYRSINGKIYSPDIDPVAGESSGGYAIGEPWSAKTPLTALHLYDMATYTGSDLWIVGSAGSNAVAWRSTDGGNTWSTSLTVSPATASYVRFYWTGVIAGRLYVQSSDATASKYFNGTSWADGPYLFGFTSHPPELFAGKLVMLKSGLSTFDGTTVTTIPNFYQVNEGGASGITSLVRDIAVSGSYFYVLKTDDTIVRSTDLANWTEVGVGPSDSTSIAVLDDYVYIGGTEARLYRSTAAISDPPPPPADTTAPSVSVTSPSSGAILSNTATIDASASDANGVTKVDFYVDGGLKGTDTSSPFSYSWDTKTVSDGTHTLTAKATDPADNEGTSVAVDITVTNATTPDPSPTPDSPSSSPVTITPTSPGSSSGGTDGGVSETVELQIPESTDPSAPKIVKVEYYLDGDLIYTSTTPPFKLALDTRKYLDGTHTLTIKKYDSTGKVTTESQQLKIQNNLSLWQQVKIRFKAAWLPTFLSLVLATLIMALVKRPRIYLDAYYMLKRITKKPFHGL